MKNCRLGRDRPLLDHIAVRVASLEPIAAQARRRGLDITVAADTFTVVLPGPEKLKLGFVEQDPGDD